MTRRMGGHCHEDADSSQGQNPEANSKLEEWRLFCIKALGQGSKADKALRVMCCQEKSIFNILNLCSGEIALRLA